MGRLFSTGNWLCFFSYPYLPCLKGTQGQMTYSDGGRLCQKHWGASEPLKGTQRNSLGSGPVKAMVSQRQPRPALVLGLGQQESGRLEQYE